MVKWNLDTAYMNLQSHNISDLEHTSAKNIYYKVNKPNVKVVSIATCINSNKTNLLCNALSIYLLQYFIQKRKLNLIIFMINVMKLFENKLVLM